MRCHLTFPPWEVLQWQLSYLSGANTVYELRVEGMSCGHCINAVTRAVQGVDAAARVDVDLEQQKVRIDSSASLDDIKSAVEEAGYPVLQSAG